MENKLEFEPVDLTEYEWEKFQVIENSTYLWAKHENIPKFHYDYKWNKCNIGPNIKHIWKKYQAIPTYKDYGTYLRYGETQMYSVSLAEYECDRYAEVGNGGRYIVGPLKDYAHVYRKYMCAPGYNFKAYRLASGFDNLYYYNIDVVGNRNNTTEFITVKRTPQRANNGAWYYTLDGSGDRVQEWKYNKCPTLAASPMQAEPDDVEYLRYSYYLSSVYGDGTFPQWSTTLHYTFFLYDNKPDDISRYAGYIITLVSPQEEEPDRYYMVTPLSKIERDGHITNLLPVYVVKGTHNMEWETTFDTSGLS